MKKMMTESPISPLQKIMSLPPPSLKSLSKCNSSTIEDSADYHPPLYKLSRAASTVCATQDESNMKKPAVLDEHELDQLTQLLAKLEAK